MFFLSLNDDCLRFIAEYLSLEEQISLAHVCTRLQLVVEDIWHHTSKKVIVNRDQCDFFKDHEGYFFEFMRCISDKVEDLELDRITCSNLHSLHELDFPKVESLRISTCFGDRTNYDQDIQLFTKLFPNLSRLSICSGITGQHLWKLKNLDELHLTTCENLRTKHFQKIFSSLRLKKLTLMYYGYNTCLDERVLSIVDCKTLEELYIDDHHLITMINPILQLKHLRKITTYTRDYDVYLLDEISKQVGEAMHTLILNDVFWSKENHCDSIQRMINLRRLIIAEDDIQNDQLRLIGKALSASLEEFAFIDIRAQLENEDGLLDLISECINLKVFDISNTSVDMKFVYSVAEVINKQQGKRSTPLLLRCYRTMVTHMDVLFHPLPEMLHVSLDQFPTELPGGRHFQCEWRTRHNDSESVSKESEQIN